MLSTQPLSGSLYEPTTETLKITLLYFVLTCLFLAMTFEILLFCSRFQKIRESYTIDLILEIYMRSPDYGESSVILFQNISVSA